MKKPSFVEKFMETIKNILKLPGIDLKYDGGLKVITGVKIIPYDRSVEVWSTHGSSERLPSPIEYLLKPADFESAIRKHG